MNIYLGDAESQTAWNIADLATAQAYEEHNIIILFLHDHLSTCSFLNDCVFDAPRCAAARAVSKTAASEANRVGSTPTGAAILYQLNWVETRVSEVPSGSNEENFTIAVRCR